VEITGLSKSFGFRRVLKGLNLNIHRGECLVVFGPNGAGKTTLIRVLATLSRPSKGKVRLDGLDVGKDAKEVRQRIGVVSHQTFLYDNLTARENLEFYGKMYDVCHIGERLAAVVEQVGMHARIDDRVGVLSRGMQQRLSIARALLHDPTILLLDEPETGLDQQAVSMLTELLKTLTAGERTVLLTTHNLGLGLALGDRVVILNKGRIAYEEETQHLGVHDIQEAYRRCIGASL